MARFIYIMRGRRVLLDRDLAELYGVSTKVLNQAVKRHARRFPVDFMFQLTVPEAVLLRSQTVTAKLELAKQRFLPHAFTEQGVAMLSSVLNSDRAIRVNIAIMRAFVRLRRGLSAEGGLSGRMRSAEAAIAEHDRELTERAAHINAAFAAIRKFAP